MTARATAGRAPAVRTTLHWTMGPTLGLALAVAIAGTTAAPATAQPDVRPRAGAQGVLTPAVPVDLGTGVVPGSVVVDESSSGSHVAVAWRTRPTSGATKGRDQVWARVKTGRTWGRAVRLSTPKHAAVRPSIDVDSNGSLLVAWAERRKGRAWVVLRRLTGEKAGGRVVINARPTDGPYVSGGALHDAVVWSARADGAVRPYASVDAGAGYPKGKRISTSNRDVVPGTLSVDSAGPQVMAAWFSRQGSQSTAVGSWAVRDTFRSSTWRTREDAEVRQTLNRPAHTTGLATDTLGRTVLLLPDEFRGARYPSVRMWTPAEGGRPGWIGDPKDLSDPDLPDAPGFDGLHTRRGTVTASRPDSPGMLIQVLPPTGTSPSQTYTAAVNTPCAGYENWFAIWVGDDPELHCLVPHETTGATEVWHANIGAQATIAVDPRVGGTLDVEVPTPNVPVLLATERPRSGAARTWLIDHTQGGTARAVALRSFTKVKKPKVTGKARVGKTLKVSAGSWRPAPARVTQRWYANGKAIKGATKSKLRLTKKLKGKKISVKVKVRHAGVRATATTVKVKSRVKK